MIICPLSVPVGKKKFILNLGNYRNTHYQVLNKAKIAYQALIRNQVALLPKYEKITVNLTLYPKTKRLCDIDNVLSIHCKFFLDTLTSLGKIEDDNYKFVPEVSYFIGEVDKHNSRVEIEVKGAK